MIEKLGAFNEGLSKIIGTSTHKIVDGISLLLTDDDRKASERIAELSADGQKIKSLYCHLKMSLRAELKVDNIPYFLVVMQMLLAFACIVFFISGLDDLFIDLYFWIRRFYRNFFVMTKYQPLTEQQILDKPEQFIAIMLPAWDESAVISRMLRNTLKSINYTNYYIFVGVYPNDPKTHAEVEKVMVENDHIHLCITGGDGPTNKADCLSWICNGIRTFEQKNNIKFAYFIMQDCEDVIHPLCYKLFVSKSRYGATTSIVIKP